MGNITVEEFTTLIAGITGRIAGRPLDGALDAWLNAEIRLTHETSAFDQRLRRL
jgi:hypothetical protein